MWLEDNWICSQWAAGFGTALAAHLKPLVAVNSAHVVGCEDGPTSLGREHAWLEERFVVPYDIHLEHHRLEIMTRSLKKEETTRVEYSKIKR